MVPSPRTLQQVSDDVPKAFSDLNEIINGIKDKETAKAAVPNVKEGFDRTILLLREFQAVAKDATRERRQQFDQSLWKLEILRDQAFGGLQKRVPNIPDELATAFLDGKEAIQQAKEDIENNVEPPPPPAPTEILAGKQPDKSTWMMGVLVLGIVGACVGFLFGDGIWSNAIRLVNLIFAGLLTMTFFEPAAAFISGYQEDIHTFAAFLDFLTFWTCFVFFMAIFLAVTDKVSRVRVRFLQIAERIGGPLLAACIGWVMAGIVLASLHAAPLAEYPMLGTFQPQANMFFGMFAPDREWLGFTKYQSGGTFYCGHEYTPDFIKNNDQRRKMLEQYIVKTDAIRVNKDFIRQPVAPKPTPAPTPPPPATPPAKPAGAQGQPPAVNPAPAAAPGTKPAEKPAGAKGTAAK